METDPYPAGTLVVRTAQPLANLAANLLETQSTGGILTWDFFDRYPVPQWERGFLPYPVYMILERTELSTYQVFE
jgi:hypothetical protein